MHRDIKPGNIMLVADHRDEDVRVLDFGIAKIFDADDDPTQLTVSGRAIGTPSYMSPEQVRGKVAGPATDIYSAGVLLFHLLTGHKPFIGESVFDIYRQHLEDEPDTGRHAIPEPLAKVIRRAMAKDPEARFSSASGMRTALALAAQIANVPVHAIHQGADTVESGPPIALVDEISDVSDAAPAERPPQPEATHRGLAIVGALIALAVLLFALPWRGPAIPSTAATTAVIANAAGPRDARPPVPLDHDTAPPMPDTGPDTGAPDAEADAVVDARPLRTRSRRPRARPKRRVERPQWRQEIERARDAKRTFRYREAESRLNKAHALAPAELLPLLELGKLYLGQKRFRLAESVFMQARERHPRHEETLFLLARAKNARGTDTYLYLYRQEFPGGRFADEVARLLAPGG